MAVIGGLAAAALAGGAAAYGTRERAGARFKQDPYSIEALKNLSATRSRLQDLGLGRNKDIQALLDELLARPDRGYAADYGKKFSPFIGQALDIARSPEDDELTRYMEQQYMRGVGDELSKVGLVGQGRGADLTNEALLRFRMGARATADQRRASALGEARSLSDLLREVDLGGRERTLGGIEDITRFQRENIGSTIGIDEQLLRNPLTQAAYQDWRDRRTAPTAAEAGVNSGISAFGATYGAMSGMGGGGQGAGSPYGTSPYGQPSPTMQPGTSAGGYGVGSSGSIYSTPYRQPRQTGMTQWGTPIYG